MLALNMFTYFVVENNNKKKSVENNFAPLRFEKKSVCRELQESKNCLKYQPKHNNCLNKLQSKENVNFPRQCKCLVYEFRQKKLGIYFFNTG